MDDSFFGAVLTLCQFKNSNRVDIATEFAMVRVAPCRHHRNLVRVGSHYSLMVGSWLLYIIVASTASGSSNELRAMLARRGVDSSSRDVEYLNCAIRTPKMLDAAIRSALDAPKGSQAVRFGLSPKLIN